MKKKDIHTTPGDGMNTFLILAVTKKDYTLYLRVIPKPSIISYSIPNRN